jgi:hypothetical protein
MPNLIHFLDATSLSLLYEKFTYSFKETNPQFSLFRIVLELQLKKYFIKNNVSICLFRYLFK